MLAAQIQNLPPAAPPKKKKRRVGGGWPHDPAIPDEHFEAAAAALEHEAEVELGALVKETQDAIAVLADEMSVEVDDLDTEVMVESSHVVVTPVPAPRTASGRRRDDDT